MSNPILKITIQVDRFPSGRDIHAQFELSKLQIQNVLQAIDNPDEKCDPFTRTFICTNPKIIRQVNMSRKELAAYLSQQLTQCLISAMEQNDTTMGYRE